MTKNILINNNYDWVMKQMKKKKIFCHYCDNNIEFRMKSNELITVDRIKIDYHIKKATVY